MLVSFPLGSFGGRSSCASPFGTAGFGLPLAFSQGHPNKRGARSSGWSACGMALPTSLRASAAWTEMDSRLLHLGHPIANKVSLQTGYQDPIEEATPVAFR